MKLTIARPDSSSNEPKGVASKGASGEFSAWMKTTRGPGIAGASLLGPWAMLAGTGSAYLYWE